MDGKFHLIIPMAGRGSRFSNEGFNLPKPLLEIYHKPFFYWATQSVVKFMPPKTLTFVVLEEHIKKYGIDERIKNFYPSAEIISLFSVTDGAVITSLKGTKNINDDLPVMFNDCDHLFKCSPANNSFYDDADGILLTFNSSEPKYSFVLKDKNGKVIKTAEKQVLSNEAICGCYYFRSKKIFEDNANEYLEKCNYNEYFMSGVYNIMIEKGMRVKTLETDFHISFGTPEEYGEALSFKRYEVFL